MKQLTLQLPDGNPAPATDFGNVPRGVTTPSRELHLVNTGTETITGGVEARVIQNGAADGTYQVTIVGVNLTDEWQLVHETDLPVGESLLVREAWHTPQAANVSGPDLGTFEWRHLI